MNYTDVDADRVLSVKGQIANDISGMARTSDVFKSRVLSTLDGCWQGQAKESFTVQFNAFSTAFDSFVKTCEELNGKLENVAKGYNGADGDVRSLVNNLPGSLG